MSEELSARKALAWEMLRERFAREDIAASLVAPVLTLPALPIVLDSRPNWVKEAVERWGTEATEPRMNWWLGLDFSDAEDRVLTWATTPADQIIDQINSMWATVDRIERGLPDPLTLVLPILPAPLPKLAPAAPLPRHRRRRFKRGMRK